MKRALVGLGSNLDDPAGQVRDALGMLGRVRASALVRCSPLYATPPWGDPDQPEFVNAVAELQTALSPAELLAGLHALEQRAGRVRDPDRRWGPRRLDLDLLWFDGASIDRPELTVPHPRMHQRAFVLQPLADLDPGLELPGRGRVDALLESLDRSGIRMIDPAPLASLQTSPRAADRRVS